MLYQLTERYKSSTLHTKYDLPPQTMVMLLGEAQMDGPSYMLYIYKFLEKSTEKTTDVISFNNRCRVDKFLEEWEARKE